MNQTRNILFLVLAFMIVGLVTIFFTHEAKKTDYTTVQEDYIKEIEPWIDSVLLDQSPANIAIIKNNFLNFHSADRSIGSAHIALFLAFDAWERFYLTGDQVVREQSIKHFSTALGLLPDLSDKIDNLISIIQAESNYKLEIE
ncbi:MAG: hypothetical protein WCS88_00415 [Patescibacteria group bacterium]|jgi:hypothetical protein